MKPGLLARWLRGRSPDMWYLTAFINPTRNRLSVYADLEQEEARLRDIQHRLCVHGHESFLGQERKAGMPPRSVLDFSGIRHKTKKEWYDANVVVSECGLVLWTRWRAIPGDYVVTCLDCMAADKAASLETCCATCP